MARVVVTLPATAKRGEVIEIRTLAGHQMETGFRHTELGVRIARDISTRFTCTYNGEEVLRADLHPALAANPLIVAARPGGNPIMLDGQLVGTISVSGTPDGHDDECALAGLDKIKSKLKLIQ